MGCPSFRVCVACRPILVALKGVGQPFSPLVFPFQTNITYAYYVGGVKMFKVDQVLLHRPQGALGIELEEGKGGIFRLGRRRGGGLGGRRWKGVGAG